MRRSAEKGSRFLPLIGLILALVATACAQQVALKGTDLGKEPASEIHLHDPSGKAVSLSDFRGKVVVLTFLYTHCPDECPLIAEHLRTTSQMIGNTMNQVAFVAVSVDPENDTPDAISSFLQEHGLTGKLIYLVGTAQELAPVWSEYFIAAEPYAASTKTITHSTRVIVIDKSGKQRVNLDSDFGPSDLAFDLRALANE